MKLLFVLKSRRHCLPSQAHFTHVRLFKTLEGAIKECHHVKMERIVMEAHDEMIPIHKLIYWKGVNSTDEFTITQQEIGD